jgi:hypothetical protein
VPKAEEPKIHGISRRLKRPVQSRVSVLGGPDANLLVRGSRGNRRSGGFGLTPCEERSATLRYLNGVSLFDDWLDFELVRQAMVLCNHTLSLKQAICGK